MSLHEEDIANIKWVAEIVREKIDARFYGDITFKFTNGRISQCIENTSLHPPSLTISKNAAKTAKN